MSMKYAIILVLTKSLSQEESSRRLLRNSKEFIGDKNAHNVSFKDILVIDKMIDAIIASFLNTPQLTSKHIFAFLHMIFTR